MKILFTIAFVFLLNQFVFSQIQSPSSFLGYELGTYFTYQHNVTAYFKHLAENSSRVKLQSYGESVEGRELFTVLISSEQNIVDSEKLRINNLRASQFAEGTITGKHLPICWLSYNIHGNESVSSEAAMQVAYDLATGQKKEFRNWLEDIIVVIDPCENLDGRARYVNWYKQKKGKYLNPLPADWEHREPWPGGRYNHYFFDLNRDWAWQTQQESQARTQHYHQWMPHIHVDLHEMGVNSPYFFGPSAEPFHNAITDWQREFHQLSGINHAKYFDGEGWLYFTQEVFDMLYPSYGDTWPTFQGAIGFTYEQGGSGFAGLGILTETGDTLTLTDRLLHHHAASISTVELTWQNRERLLKEHKIYFEQNTNNPTGQYKTYVVKYRKERKADIDQLKQLLDKQKIQYGTFLGSRNANGYNYLKRQNTSLSIEPNDLVISTFQPQSRLLNVLFEPSTYFSDSLTYDLTAWALPYVYDLEAFALTEKITPVDETQATQTALLEIDPERPYAYMAKWHNFNDVKFLASLLNQGIKIRFSQQKFSMSGEDFDRGSLIITAFDNRHKHEAFDSAIINTANAFQKDIYSTESGLTTKGVDFGSSSVNFITAPKVAILGGNGVSATAFGETWFYFAEELEYPVTVIGLDYFNRVSLSGFDVVIAPSGNYRDVSEELLQFVENGGKLIAIERSVNTFSRNSGTLLGKIYEGTRSNEPQQERANLLPYAQKARNKISGGVEGSIFEVKLDATHPLAYGQDGQFFLIKRNSNTYPLLTAGGWNVGIFRENSHVSGFAGYKLKEKVKNSLAIGLEEMGDGQLIYFSDSPIIRAFWHSGKLLLGNAVFFAGNDR